MCLKQHEDAKLQGYDGPIFPPIVDFLNRRLDPIKDPPSLGYLYGLTRALGIKGIYVPGLRNVVTSDGYMWDISIGLSVGYQKAAFLLVPFCRDLLRVDLSPLDRSMAIYLRNTTLEEAEKTLEHLRVLY